MSSHFTPELALKMLQEEIFQTSEKSPKELSDELNQYIVGQQIATETMATAWRDRIRKLKVLDPEIQEEISPKNILMIGSTGVGKTEIARRLSKILKIPFLKVEATKYTEVGYVGKDVTSMIDDLMQITITQIKDKMRKMCMPFAQEDAEQQVITLAIGAGAQEKEREKVLQALRDGTYTKMIEVPIEKPLEFQGFAGNEFKFTGQKALKIMSAMEAVEHFYKIALEKLLDNNLISEAAIQIAQTYGIIFIDEIDKIAHGKNQGHEQVSREGVQRGLLTLIEGTIVSTKHGDVDTRNILFIGAGAFHTAKPEDLTMELQGRLPIKITLNKLTATDFEKILSQKKVSLLEQKKALLATDNIYIHFTDSGIQEIASTAFGLNTKQENLGARRLDTLIEKLLVDISFDIERYHNTTIAIDGQYVKDKLSNSTKGQSKLSVVL